MDKTALTVAEVVANIDMETFRAVVSDPEVEEHVTKAEALYRSAAVLRERIRILENEAESAEAQMDRAYDAAKSAALQAMRDEPGIAYDYATDEQHGIDRCIERLCRVM